MKLFIVIGNFFMYIYFRLGTWKVVRASIALDDGWNHPSDSPYMSAKIFFENLLLSIFFNNWFLLKNINVKICYILFQYYLKKKYVFLGV